MSAYVNTSLPAKQAPALKPGTLASLTSDGVPLTTGASATGASATATAGAAAGASAAYVPPHSRSWSKPLAPLQPMQKRTVALQSEQEFPALGGKKVVTPVKPSTNTSFSDLAKDWAKKQKEEEEQKKKEEELAALNVLEERKLRDSLEKGIRVNFHRMTIGKKKEENFYEDERPVLAEDDYGLDEPVYEEEDTEEEEYDSTTYKKTKKELSTF
jgi:hypothetical protein